MGRDMLYGSKVHTVDRLQMRRAQRQFILERNGRFLYMVIDKNKSTLRITRTNYPFIVM